MRGRATEGRTVWTDRNSSRPLLSDQQVHKITSGWIYGITTGIWLLFVLQYNEEARRCRRQLGNSQLTPRPSLSLCNPITLLDPFISQSPSIHLRMLLAAGLDTRKPLKAQRGGFRFDSIETEWMKFKDFVFLFVGLLPNFDGWLFHYPLRHYHHPLFLLLSQQLCLRGETGRGAKVTSIVPNRVITFSSVEWSTRIPTFTSPKSPAS